MPISTQDKTAWDKAKKELGYPDSGPVAYGTFILTMKRALEIRAEAFAVGKEAENVEK